MSMAQKFKHAVSARLHGVFTLLLGSVMLSSTSLLAKQLDFELTYQNDAAQFEYVWQDVNGKTHTLAFALDAKTLLTKHRHFVGYQPERLNQEKLSALLTLSKTLDARNERIEVLSISPRIEYKISTRNQAQQDDLMARVKTAMDDTLNNYLERVYYHQFDDASGRMGIKADHTRFVNEAMEDVSPIIKAAWQANENAPPRVIINYLLGWLQSIPYQVLEGRGIHQRSDFLPPLRLLRENRGDCDSKAVLMAALIKSLYPRLGVALIYLPDHAVIGFQLPTLASDNKVKIEGLDFVLAETAGPGLIPLAELSPYSDGFIRSNSFHYELL